MKHSVDEQNGNPDRKAKEIYTDDFGSAVFLEAIAAHYHQSQSEKYRKNAQQKDRSCTRISCYGDHYIAFVGERCRFLDGLNNIDG